MYELYILIALSEITDKLLVSRLNLINFFLVEALVLAGGCLKGLLEGLLDEVFFVPFDLGVEISLNAKIDALPLRHLLLLPSEPEKVHHVLSLLVYVDIALISSNFMLCLLYNVCCSCLVLVLMLRRYYHLHLPLLLMEIL